MLLRTAKENFCICIISYNKRPLHDKLRIVNNGRPAPPAEHKTKTERYTKHFCISQYEKIDWLVGCEITNKRYCWPCLLFSNKHEVWNK